MTLLRCPLTVRTAVRALVKDMINFTWKDLCDELV